MDGNASHKFNSSDMREQNGDRISVRFSGCMRAGILILTLAVAGCSSTPRPGSHPANQVLPRQLTGIPAGPVTASVLQAQVMRFADTYVAMVSQACDDITAATTNADIRLAALRWKLQQGTAAYNDATGPNPSVNALDLLVLATMARYVVEDYGVTIYGQDVVSPLIEAHQDMQTNAWTMAEGFLTPTQEKELRSLINEWRRRNPRQHEVGPIRFREFAAALGQAPPQSRIRPTSIFSLLYLNPLAGLDPTTAAIEGMHQLGERTMFYTQRMPTLLNWQVQLLALELAAQPQSAQMFANINQFASAASVLSGTARQLPQVINDQRQAAIQQILDGLISDENKSSQFLTNSRLTLYAVGNAATNLNTAILSLSEFMRILYPTNAPESENTNSQPFDVLHYGIAATQIGDAARNLNTLLTTLNQTTPQLETLSQRTIANTNGVLDRAFWLALVLIIFLLAGSVVAALTYRAIASKMTTGGRKTPESKS